jgi:hypothetical protein
MDHDDLLIPQEMEVSLKFAPIFQSIIRLDCLLLFRLVLSDAICNTAHFIENVQDCPTQSLRFRRLSKFGRSEIW